MISYEHYSKIRDLKGLKDGKVAELAGIGRSTFSDWKSGRSNPKDEKLMKIAAALGVTYAYMIGMESEPNASTAALEHNIAYNDEHGGKAEFSKFLHRTTSSNPAALQLSSDELKLIELYRSATPERKAAIEVLLGFALEQENKNNDN